MIDYYLFCDIVDLEVRQFAEFAGRVPDGSELRICITSYGGDVFSAMAMIYVIREMQGRGVYIKADIMGLCASAATMIALACNQITMRENAVMMFHSASGPDKAVVRHINDVQRSLIEGWVKDPAAVEELLSADDSYLSAEQALELGLCNAIEIDIPVESLKTALAAASAQKRTITMGGIRMEEEKRIEEERKDVVVTEEGGVDIMALIESLTRAVEDLSKRVADIEADRRQENIEENIDDVIEARARDVYARLAKITKPVKRASAKAVRTPEQDLDRAKTIYGNMTLPD